MRVEQQGRSWSLIPRAEDWPRGGEIAGVDEAGRGPLAGPVVAAAVILKEPNPVVGLTDSKRLSESRRVALFQELLGSAWAAGLGWAESEEVDAVNVLNATFRAMERAVAALEVKPAQIRIDGHLRPPGLAGAECIVRGDVLDPAIAAGSILAKVMRDHWMVDCERLYPGYGFARNKGYATAEHRRALDRQGPCAIHRRSFAPVQRSSLAKVGEIES